MKMNGINTAQTGLAAAATTLDVSAHNVANALTPNFSPLRADAAEAAEGGVRVSISRDARALDASGAGGAQTASRTNLVAETATRISAVTAYRANLKTIETMEDVSGVLMRLGGK
jgi:flagellar hook-associated protein FlgK